MIQNGIRIVWSMAECPPLPLGYFVVQKLNCETRAIGPDGSEYLVALDPPRLVKILQRNPTRCDFANPIMLPTTTP